jgi:threonine dehydrogenase-like Zn-dependent dehydrogenase
VRAIWIEAGRISLRDVPPPALAPGEARVRVRLAGICATDLELVRGYATFAGVPGHEFVGEVLSAPEQPDLVGRRVVGEINAACGSCPTCRAGRPRHCPRRTVLGIAGRSGAFAEELALPAGNLHPVPDSVADELAVFVEPLAAALAVQDSARLRPSDRVLVVGAGRLGQLIARTLALAGCALEVVARHPRQRALVAARGIAAVAEEEVRERSADCVVEASGSPAGLALARRAVRPGGTIVLKSTYHAQPALDLARLVVDEITLAGSRCGPFAAALRLLASRALDPRDLIDAAYPREQGEVAFAAAALPGALKILLAS